MEQWEIDFNWLKIQHFVKDYFKINSLPKLDTILFIIGLQELGQIKPEFTHEEKLGITTLGTMEVLSREGYFTRLGNDNDGWPDWQENKHYNPTDETQRQNQLKKLVIVYFEEKYDISNYEQKI